MVCPQGEASDKNDLDRFNDKRSDETSDLGLLCHNKSMNHRIINPAMGAYTVATLVMGVLLIVCSGSTLAQQPLQQPTPQSIQVEVTQKKVHYPGLPIVVTVEIVNISTETQVVRVPSTEVSNLGNVYGRLKKEGATEYLIPSIIRHYWGLPKPIKLLSLKPRRKVSVPLNLTMNFQDDLPVGRYLCEVSYYPSMGVESVQAKPTLITIAEPINRDPYVETSLRHAMFRFLAAKTYLTYGDGDDRIANTLFRHVAASLDSEYSRISEYYVAVTEKDTEKKLEALNRYLERPSFHLPHILNENATPLGEHYIHQWLGKLYFESGNLTAAKQSFLKIPEPDTEVQGYLKKIQAAAPTTR